MDTTRARHDDSVQGGSLSSCPRQHEPAGMGVSLGCDFVYAHMDVAVEYTSVGVVRRGWLGRGGTAKDRER